MKTLRTKTTKSKNAKRPRTLPRVARAPKAAKEVANPSPVEAPRAPETPKAVFTLAEFSEAFGFAYDMGENPENPLVLARNALDDARRTMRLLEEMCVGNVDLEPMQDVLCNAGKRAEVANALLRKVGAA
jgi:hypothetical protein